ncbi:MAG: helix-turn-helix transcriptional regulator [Lachnospiraceae bacterium]|nr:helix-turn-helix transcriptional regulator [Lachnospiraceae bacterium]
MFTESIQYEIGQRIKKIRLAQGATQAQFSEKVYITPNFLSEIENGKKGLSCETLYNICETQSLSSDYLLFGDTSDEKPPAEYIMEIAPNLSLKELSVVITYLDALKKMKEL